MRITKQDLCTHYGIALNTVRRTFKCAGISTKQRSYSPEEIAKFHQARKLFNAGLSAQEVSDIFQSPIKKIEQV